MELLHSGKVREVYLDRGDIVLVASDRVSVYDVVLPTAIPDKGSLLTALSLRWFERTADVVTNHVISADDVPEEVRRRAIRCPKAGHAAGEVHRARLPDRVGAARVPALRIGVRCGVAARAGRRVGVAGADLHADHQGAGGPA